MGAGQDLESVSFRRHLESSHLSGQARWDSVPHWMFDAWLVTLLGIAVVCAP